MLNVLVVDDSLVIRAMTANLLQNDREINVVGAVSSTREAAEILSKQIVDVVTLDIEMPGGSGLDYLDTLVRRKIPVIMLSGQTGEGTATRAAAMAKGASACFDKANAVRNADHLIKLVKDAGAGKVTLNAVDKAAREGGSATQHLDSSSDTRDQTYYFHVMSDTPAKDGVGSSMPSLRAAIAHGHELLNVVMREGLMDARSEMKAGIAIVDASGSHVATLSTVTRTVVRQT